MQCSALGAICVILRRKNVACGRRGNKDPSQASDRSNSRGKRSNSEGKRSNSEGEHSTAGHERSILEHERPDVECERGKSVHFVGRSAVSPAKSGGVRDPMDGERSISGGEARNTEGESGSY